MSKVTTAIILGSCIFCVYLSGCGNKVLDPAQIGRFRSVPTVNVILDSLGVAEETPSTWEDAEAPLPADVMSIDSDYTFGSGDVLSVSIFELLSTGVTDARRYTVTETGKISIPEVGDIKVAGLSESQLEDEIKDILSPSLLKDPSVTVSLLESQRLTYSIQGEGIPRPNRYAVPRYDFRLLDALAMAGGVSQFNISYIYVTRNVTGNEPIEQLAQTQIPQTQMTEPALGETDTKPEINPEREMLEIIAPSARVRVENRLVITSAEMITEQELAQLAAPEELNSSQQQNIDNQDDKDGETEISNARQSDDQEVYGTIIEKPIQQQAGRIEWIFRDGRWVPIQIPDGQSPESLPVGKSPEQFVREPLRKRVPDNFQWTQIGTGGVQTRVIKIPAERLFGGDPRYNLVIKAGDNINVPVDMIGEFSIMGNVNRTGSVSIYGRPFTLKMAIASAGGLGPLAWPKSCEVIRRIGKNREEIVMVDLDKIARGEQPDFFIKPNDLINVGTHPTSRWRAVLRNAFRATYGFGFIYDRNFADRDYGTRRPIPNLF